MKPILFVTGIDTNIGKTYATAFLANLYAQKGLRIITQKMIQTGCDERSEDIEMHRQLLGQPYLPEDEAFLTAPIIYSYPCSPHMAARLDNRPLDISLIDKASDELLARGYERIIMEGAGGLMVPITETYLTADFVVERGYPVSIVTNGRLGSINHTLLTLEVCKYRGIEVESVVFNMYPNIDPKITDDTWSYLQQYLSLHFPATAFYKLDEHS